MIINQQQSIKSDDIHSIVRVPRNLKVSIQETDKEGTCILVILRDIFPYFSIKTYVVEQGDSTEYP